ncbi:hypothetical protein TRFO_37886 [Tritrichomonas foetus]|uniref:Uncharacterized protein n=1 Tax=Tritrichomonas foetus TaxID=1144522 RepID=A0A1J4J9Y6_9EUKA|nr:hypothetical protein TRFO_37886 [Tritrichomonas foetus]|eukprot:OHS95968.1 hypothetical protein TRFO_37886 [Tritrichomonas foetus]
MERDALIKFGIFQDSIHVHNYSDITSVCMSDNDSYILATPSQIVKINGHSIIDSSPLQFSSVTFASKHNLLIAISHRSFSLFVLPLNDLGRPILANYPTSQLVVSFVIFAPKSDTIITIGEKIKVWKLNVIHYSPSIPPGVSISCLRTFKGTFGVMSYSSVGFDENQEILFIPTNDGIRLFTIEGELVQTVGRITATMSSLFVYSQNNREILTYDRSEGMSLWSSIGTLVKRIPFGGSTVSTMEFVDDENVLVTDENGALYLLNVKTNRSFLCLTLPRKPIRVFVIHTRKPMILVLFENTYELMRVSIPWTVFATHVVRPIHSNIVPKINYRSRLLVQTENSFAKLFSPNDGTIVTAATPSCPASPVSLYYDRGCIVHYEKSLYKSYKAKIIETDSNKEVLLMCLDDGQTIIFDTIASPAKEVSIRYLRAKYIMPCIFNNEWCYVATAEGGDISLFNYNDFTLIASFNLTNTKIVSVNYHAPSNTLIAQYSNELIRFSFDQKTIVGKISLGIKSTLTEIFDESIFVCDVDGKIHKFTLENNLSITKDSIEISGHNSAISSISFGPTFFLSSSMDGTVVVWDYSFNKVSVITSPLPIYVVSWLNGGRDIILGTESELMQISGREIFRDEDVDDENFEIDNFCRKIDISNEQVKIVVPETQKSNFKKCNSRYKELLEQHQQKMEIKTQLLERIHGLQSISAPRNQNTGKPKKIEESRRRRIVDDMYNITMNAFTETSNQGIMQTQNKITKSQSNAAISSERYSDGSPLLQNLEKVIIVPPVKKEEEKAPRNKPGRSKSSNRRVENSKNGENSIGTGKDFIKKSLVKDEKSKKRREARRMKKIEKEKEMRRKATVLQVCGNETLTKQTSQERLLASMDTSLTIGEIPKAAPVPEIYFRPPCQIEQPASKKISRPIRRVSERVRKTAKEFVKQFEQNQPQPTEEEAETLKVVKKKKSLKKRLKRAPTPPEVRKFNLRSKGSQRRRKRAKTPPTLEAPPKVVKYKKCDHVIDDDIVQEVFLQKEVHGGRKISKKSISQKEETKKLSFRQHSDKSSTSTRRTDHIETDFEEDNELLHDSKSKYSTKYSEKSLDIQLKNSYKGSFRESCKGPLRGSLDDLHELEGEFAINSDGENFNANIFETGLDECKPNNVFQVVEPPPKNLDVSSLSTILGEFNPKMTDDEQRVRNLLFDLAQFRCIKLPKEKNEITRRNFNKRLDEIEQKIAKLTEEAEINPLAWRGIPPKLQKMIVESISIDDFFDETPQMFSERGNWGRNVQPNRRENQISKRSVESNIDFMADWRSKKTQLQKKSWTKARVSKVEKKKPWRM